MASGLCLENSSLTAITCVYIKIGTEYIYVYTRYGDRYLSFTYSHISHIT